MRLFIRAFFLLLLAATVFYFKDTFLNRRSPIASGKGTLIFDHVRTQDGYNLLEAMTKNGEPVCWVLNLKGDVLGSLPGNLCAPMGDNGFAFSSKDGLEFLDKNFHKKWSHIEEVHHDLTTDLSTQSIFAWTKKLDTKYLSKFFTHIDELKGYSFNGDQIFRWNSLDHLKEFEHLLGRPIDPIPYTAPGEWEISHFNAVQVLPKNQWAAKNPAFREGNLLLTTIYPCTCLVVIDRTSGAVVWYHQDSFGKGSQIHSGRLLENGNILYFQNHTDQGDIEKGLHFSAVAELNPLSHQNAWSYRAKENGTFFSEMTGSVSRLRNGNTLITNLVNGGSAFEVTREGRVVWEWDNGTEAPIFAAKIYQVRRISDEREKKFLERGIKFFSDPLNTAF